MGRWDRPPAQIHKRVDSCSQAAENALDLDEWPKFSYSGNRIPMGIRAMGWECEIMQLINSKLLNELRPEPKKPVAKVEPDDVLLLLLF